jgi:hypothetical protein
MPFVTLGIIQPYISESMYSAIGQSGKFDEYENRAAIKIRDITGYPVPDDVEDRPDFVDDIAGWLIEFLAMNLIPGQSAEEIKRITSNYDKAIKEMAKYRYNADTETDMTVKVGAYEQEEVW